MLIGKKTTTPPRTHYRCSFCGKDQVKVHRLIAGPGGVFICNRCVSLCTNIIQEQERASVPQAADTAESRAPEPSTARWERVASTDADLLTADFGTGAMAHPPTPASDERTLFSPEQAADFLGIHTQTIRGYIRTGKLCAYRLAGERVIRIARADLLALLQPLAPEEL